MKAGAAGLHDATRNCWICASSELTLAKNSNIPGSLASGDFAITDYRYGVTAAIYRCRNCGFLQCSDVPELLQFYEGLQDPAYETSRNERRAQARALLDRIVRYRRPSSDQPARLLDIGAGSGILVEEARSRGFAAQGIEPSEWLARIAQERGLPVRHGVLDEQGGDLFDIVTVIDVIEHVTDPRALLRPAVSRLAPGGLLAIVTPDAGSLAARLLGWRWWHYRIAHVGYFRERHVATLCRENGLEILAVQRPGWVFTATYLAERAATYLPSALRLRPPAWLARITIPLNLYDSLMVIARRADSQPGTR